jgi:glycosyltransferase involved in cell wall biosynthesis
MISIVIPCYNCAAYISRAFNSVLKQTYTNWELFLVDNNSSDNTPEILLQLQRQYPEKVHVLFEEKPGAPCARNRGLVQAGGSWVQFLDADDELAPDKLSRQYALALKQNPALVAATYTRRGSHLGRRIRETRTVQPGDIWSALIQSNLGITSSNLWNRALLLKVNGWDESLSASQEYDLMFRMLQLRPMVAFDERDRTTVHIVPGDSISRGTGKLKRLKVLESKINLRQRIKAYLKKEDLLTTELEQQLDLFLFEQMTKAYRYTRDYEQHMQALQVPFTGRIKALLFKRKIGLKCLLGWAEK